MQSKPLIPIRSPAMGSRGVPQPTRTQLSRSITLGDSGSYQTSTVTGSTRKSGGTDSAGNHYHTMADGTTGSGSSLPPYLDMLFAEIDSDGYGEADSILIFTALPPLGWDRYSDLDDVYARGASTAGGSGDGSHSHSVTITTGGPQGLSSAGGGLVNTSSSGHTHSCSTTTSEHTNEQPYMEVIYRQRKDNQIHLEALEKGIIKLW